MNIQDKLNLFGKLIYKDNKLIKETFLSLIVSELENSEREIYTGISTNSPAEIRISKIKDHLSTLYKISPLDMAYSSVEMLAQNQFKMFNPRDPLDLQFFSVETLLNKRGGVFDQIMEGKFYALEGTIDISLQREKRFSFWNENQTQKIFLQFPDRAQERLSNELQSVIVSDIKIVIEAKTGSYYYEARPNYTIPYIFEVAALFKPY